eukprot:TRINITY_DN1696_c0_g1_i2.p1 TRINITY_DN1696_c0_g1~~TRINITY_DN1696_c0_g1_i2.p1  ORF type:complete len:342 (-),score=89.83 TRINITY_DN1696_c0_g1_i2:361-1386(-)
MYLDQQAGGGGGSGQAASAPSPAAAAAPAPNTSGAGSSSGSRKRPAGGIATLGDLGDRDDGDDEDTQNLYTGGKASGMVVQGPKKTDSTADAIFKKARDQSGEPRPAPEAPSKTGKSFGGSGYTLGDYDAQSQRVEAAQSQEPARVTKRLTFYRQGFTVDDGPLRRMDDPANAEFLDDINKGFVPREFGRVQVGIDLVDKRGEDYKEPPKPKYTAFSGGGARLGDAPTPSGPGGGAAAAGSSAGGGAGTASTSAPTNVVDDSKPTTSIQIRLSDGTRIKGKFNLDQTVGDLRKFISSARPDSGNFDLQTRAVGPPTTLSDDSQTIEAAGLANSVVMQSKRV